MFFSGHIISYIKETINRDKSEFKCSARKLAVSSVVIVGVQSKCKKDEVNMKFTGPGKPFCTLFSRH